MQSAQGSSNRAAWSKFLCKVSVFNGHKSGFPVKFCSFYLKNFLKFTYLIFGWCVCVCICIGMSVCTSMCVGICVFLCVSLCLPVCAHVCFYVSACPCATIHVWRSANILPKVLVLFFHHVCLGDWITGFKLGGKCLYSLRHLVSTIFSLKIILLFNSIYVCASVGWYIQVSTDAPKGQKKILSSLKL